MRTGAPWRDLSPDYGNRSNTHRHLARQGRVGTAFRKPD
ncbi:MAG: hypothetical protein HRT36_07460 [Alphaproteobacteria bacterium]|nr:hypothetical protein [Alphaproteobacteria bacterium]